MVFAGQQVFILHLLGKENILSFRELHPKTELIGKSTQNFIHWRDLEWVNVVEQELDTTL